MLILEKKKCLKNYLSLHVKKLDKEEKIKPKATKGND